jgi:hypothetical protein
MLFYSLFLVLPLSFQGLIYANICGCHDLSDDYMKKVSQLGVDCLGFGSGDSLPGVKEQGFLDLDELLKIKKHVQAWRMEINRMTLPDVSERYFLAGQGVIVVCGD